MDGSTDDLSAAYRRTERGPQSSELGHTCARGMQRRMRKLRVRGHRPPRRSRSIVLVRVAPLPPTAFTRPPRLPLVHGSNGRVAPLQEDKRAHTKLRWSSIGGWDAPHSHPHPHPHPSNRVGKISPSESGTVHLRCRLACFLRLWQSLHIIYTSPKYQIIKSNNNKKNKTLN